MDIMDTIESLQRSSFVLWDRKEDSGSPSEEGSKESACPGYLVLGRRGWLIDSAKVGQDESMFPYQLHFTDFSCLDMFL